MITRIQTGTSFKGAGLYYLHDKGTLETAERLAWTQAFNTLHDDPEKALSEMRQTAFDQDYLKIISGNRLDGRPTTKPVMTVALSWAKDEEPSQEHMVATGKEFLHFMGWQEHQALMVAHSDTEHPHMHIVLNRIHHETGMTLDDSFSRDRAQQWALRYEREMGRVYCENRVARYGEERTLPGDGLHYGEWKHWQELRQEIAHSPESQKFLDGQERELLKEQQKEAREAFWQETRTQVKEVRRGVWQELGGVELQEEFEALKDERQERYAEERQHSAETRRAIRHLLKASHGVETEGIQRLREQEEERWQGMREELAAKRAELLERKEYIRDAQDAAAKEFKDDRREAYREFLAAQKQERQELREAQDKGERSYHVLDRDELPPPAPPREDTQGPRPEATIRPDSPVAPGTASFEKYFESGQRHAEAAQRLEPPFDQTAREVTSPASPASEPPRQEATQEPPQEALDPALERALRLTNHEEGLRHAREEREAGEAWTERRNESAGEAQQPGAENTDAALNRAVRRANAEQRDRGSREEGYEETLNRFRRRDEGDE